MYACNGAIGCRIHHKVCRLYDHPLPKGISRRVVERVLERILEARDRYRVTNHKITVWPHGESRQKQLAQLWNELFDLEMLPVRARIGGTRGWRTSLAREPASL